MKELETILEKIYAYDDKSLCDTCVVNNRLSIVEMIKCIQVILYPNYYTYHGFNRKEAFETLYHLLNKEIQIALEHAHKEGNAKELSDIFVQMLPDIYYILQTDLQAIYDGDPAAKSKSEILLCYPGFYAILIYRIAHALYTLEIPYIPRIMTEFAHEKTGIDINPGARIGTHFCIDHGTGIVIGETAVLGHHVKLYQGVTIGAKSFEKDENGNPVKSGKRHPNIGNHVTIYANATILGGNTTIGDGSTIGGNTWIIEDVKPNTTITNK